MAEENSTGSGIKDKIQIVMDSGGWKAITLRFVMYFLFPLIVLIGIGYFAFDTFKKSQTTISVSKSKNESKVYTNENVKVQIKVEELRPNVAENKDIETFNSIKERLKAIQ